MTIAGVLYTHHAINYIAYCVFTKCEQQAFDGILKSD